MVSSVADLCLVYNTTMVYNKKRKNIESIEQYCNLDDAIATLMEIQDYAEKDISSDTLIHENVEAQKQVGKEISSLVNKTIEYIKKVQVQWTDVTGVGGSKRLASRLRNERKLKNTVMPTPTKPSPEPSPKPSPEPSPYQLPTTRARKKLFEARKDNDKEVIKTPPLKPPTFGSQYRPLSAAKQVLNHAKKYHSRIIDHLLHNNLVPVKKRRMQQVVSDAKKGTLDPAMNIIFLFCGQGETLQELLL